jgi:hypothetical protein
VSSRANDRKIAAGDSRLYTLFPVATGLRPVRVETPIPPKSDGSQDRGSNAKSDGLQGRGSNAQFALKWRSEQVDVVRHHQDTIRIPLIETFQGLAESTPSNVVCKRVAARNNTNGEKIDYLALPRKHYGNSWRPSHINDLNCRASLPDTNLIQSAFHRMEPTGVERYTRGKPEG